MMMKYFAIKDNLANMFMTPVLFQNENMALRWFSGVVNDPKENKIIFDNPADFELWKIGSYENTEGVIKAELDKMATGLSVKKEAK